MAAAFQFGMPAINFSEIFNIKRTHRQRKQLARKREYTINKWRKTYAYQLIECGRNKINYYNYLVDSAYVLYENIVPQMGSLNEDNNQLFISNINKYSHIRQSIRQLYVDIMNIQQTLRMLLITLQNITYENVKEISLFTNICVEQYKL